MKEDKAVACHTDGMSCARLPSRVGVNRLPFALVLVHQYYNRRTTMNQNLLAQFGDAEQRVQKALDSLRKGSGVLVVDDEQRENEGDLIFAAEFLTKSQMAMMIRECSGIVCLCLPGEKVRSLALPMMVSNNSSRYQTAFTVSIEAARGVTTGVSATDRVTTIRTAIADNAQPGDLNRPGHIFPLSARPGGILERPGHTEATVDLMRLAGLKPYGVLCELTNPDGSMARLPEIVNFAKKHSMAVLSVEDLITYRHTRDMLPAEAQNQNSSAHFLGKNTKKPANSNG